MTQRIDNSFSKQLRKATRDVHKISDALVNAKLAFALSDDSVWAEGLLIFYEIFKYLEEHASTDILPTEFHRKEAFEKDLNYYLGTKWKDSYEPRDEVKNYLKHLQEINEKNSILLLAYIYHLYMGLLSGGQILQKKRAIAKKFNFGGGNQSSSSTNPPGIEVTNFNDITINELKIKMRNLVDEMGKKFSDEIKEALLDESRKVFELNNEIIRTVKGVNKVNFRNFITLFMVFAVIFLGYRIFLLKSIVQNH